MGKPFSWLCKPSLIINESPSAVVHVHYPHVIKDVSGKTSKQIQIVSNHAGCGSLSRVWLTAYCVYDVPNAIHHFLLFQTMLAKFKFVNKQSLLLSKLRESRMWAGTSQHLLVINLIDMRIHTPRKDHSDILHQLSVCCLEFTLIQMHELLDLHLNVVTIIVINLSRLKDCFNLAFILHSIPCWKSSLMQVKVLTATFQSVVHRLHIYHEPVHHNVLSVLLLLQWWRISRNVGW